METRRSKRKEAAASESLAPEPRNKRARRAQADSKAKANPSRKPKADGSTARAIAVLDTSTVQVPKHIVPKAQPQSAPEPSASEAAEASTSQPESHTNPVETDLEQAMGSRKDLAEAQERAAMEQASWHPA